MMATFPCPSPYKPNGVRTRKQLFGSKLKKTKTFMIFNPKTEGVIFFDIFDPPTPPPTPSKKCVSSGGAGVQGSLDQKTHCGMHLLDKIMILKGVKPTIQPLGVGYANRAKNTQNGGVRGVFPYIRACLALI